jgi:hypothetical protein
MSIMLILMAEDFFSHPRHWNSAMRLADRTISAVTIDAAGRFTATITFRRFYFKRGKMSRWFWTAESAVRVN